MGLTTVQRDCAACDVWLSCRIKSLHVQRSRFVPPCSDWISSLVTVRLQLFESCTGCQSLRWSRTSCASAGSQVASGTHAGIYLRPSYISCQYSRSIYTARFIVWQPRRAADTSTNWRQSPFCYCTASMEQATDGAKTAAIDGLVSSWMKTFSVSFCLRAPGYGLTLWCAVSLLVGGAIQVPQLLLLLLLLFTHVHTDTKKRQLLTRCTISSARWATRHRAQTRS